MLTCVVFFSVYNCRMRRHLVVRTICTNWNFWSGFFGRFERKSRLCWSESCSSSSNDPKNTNTCMSATVLFYSKYVKTTIHMKRHFVHFALDTVPKTCVHKYKVRTEWLKYHFAGKVLLKINPNTCKCTLNDSWIQMTWCIRINFKGKWWNLVKEESLHSKEIKA